MMVQSDVPSSYCVRFRQFLITYDVSDNTHESVTANDNGQRNRSCNGTQFLPFYTVAHMFPTNRESYTIIDVNKRGNAMAVLTCSDKGIRCLTISITYVEIYMKFVWPPRPCHPPIFVKSNITSDLKSMTSITHASMCIFYSL